MALSAIALCSRALLKIGAATIASFDEGSAEAEVAANLYPCIRDALISAHPWNFATGQASLPRLVAQPVAESSARAELLYKLAEDEFRRAKLADGQQDTPLAITDFPLVEVRS